MTAYGGLFGSVAAGNSKAEFNAKTNLLDFLRDDVKRLHGQVSGAERDKLQAHLKGYEDMRNRQSRLGEIEGTLRKVAPKVTDKFKSEVESDRLDAQFDLAAAALIGGLTHSITIASGVGNPYFSVKFTGLGIDIGKHSIGHGGSFKDMSPGQLKVKIHKFHFQLMADLMKKLEACPKGDGTMLDNTVIVYLSDAAEAHHSRCGQWPFVLIPGKNTGLEGVATSTSLTTCRTGIAKSATSIQRCCTPPGKSGNTLAYATPCSRVPPEEMVRWKPCSPSSRKLTSLIRQIVISG